MASKTLPPNGATKCDRCWRPHGAYAGPSSVPVNVRYAADVKKHLCGICWSVTPPSEPIARQSG